MSADREQIWRAACDAFVDGDGDRIAALCEPDVRIASRIAAVEGREYVGAGGIRQWVEDFHGRMGAFTVEPADPPRARTDGDLTSVTGSWKLRGAGSGIEMHDRWYLVLEWSGDRFSRVHALGSREEAEQIAGFEPPTVED